MTFGSRVTLVFEAVDATEAFSSVDPVPRGGCWLRNQAVAITTRITGANNGRNRRRSFGAVDGDEADCLLCLRFLAAMGCGSVCDRRLFVSARLPIFILGDVKGELNVVRKRDSGGEKSSGTRVSEISARVSESLDQCFAVGGGHVTVYFDDL